jgi:hypothetical protein
MTRQCLRLCIYLCIHLLLQCVPHPYLASHGDYDNALFRIARRAGNGCSMMQQQGGCLPALLTLQPLFCRAVMVP